MTDDSNEWMEPVDDEILALLRDEDIFMPDQIADEVEPRSPRVAYRCRELVSHGLATKLATGMYDISEKGERYLAGDLEDDP
jgi:ArsR family transcriptional regulator, cadmium/lead-responsive transcriptional repressor